MADAVMCGFYPKRQCSVAGGCHELCVRKSTNKVPVPIIVPKVRRIRKAGNK